MIDEGTSWHLATGASDETESDPMAERVATVIDALRALKEDVTPDGRLNPKGAATLIGVEQRTLRNWRTLKTGPKYFTAGRTWYWVRDVIAWLDEREAIAVEKMMQRE
ncbi:hypothetical protein [Luteimonas mephitis]|uniref:hypothetical protein n=1 Tax=Luteimonas mephitis TaxID=83615 RepID=UPI0004229068|nr:hypothetical protein [Luteimonas mephitis]